MDLGLACGTELALSFLNAIVVGVHHFIGARFEVDHQGALQGIEVKFTALKGPRHGVVLHIETLEGLGDKLGASDLLCADRGNLGQVIHAVSPSVSMNTYLLDAEMPAVGTARNRIVLTTAHFTGKRHVVKAAEFIAQLQRNATVHRILQCHTLIYCHLSNYLLVILVRRGTVDGFHGLECHG